MKTPQEYLESINDGRVVYCDGKRIEDVKIVFMGAGSANIRCADVIFQAGAAPGNCIMYDSKGSLCKDRSDIRDNASLYEKWKICRTTNKGQFSGSIGESLKGADVLIALSKPGPDTVKHEWIRGMADNAIVFVCANPVPEIWPWKAKEAGALVVATGRSDFPNQVNNSLGFPGIFRGTLDVRANTITDEMCIAAAEELAKTAEDKGLSEDYIIPTMDEWEVFPREAAAVGMKAIEQGVAEIVMEREELLASAEEIIKKSREGTKLLMEKGFMGDIDKEF